MDSFCCSSWYFNDSAVLADSGIELRPVLLINLKQQSIIKCSVHSRVPVEQRQKQRRASSAGNNEAAGDSYWENFELGIRVTGTVFVSH